MFLTLFTVVGRRIHSACRTYGEGRYIHQRSQDRSGNVSPATFHRLQLAQTRENSVDELVDTAAKQLSTANSFAISKAKLRLVYCIGSRMYYNHIESIHIPYIFSSHWGYYLRPSRNLGTWNGSNTWDPITIIGWLEEVSQSSVRKEVVLVNCQNQLSNKLCTDSVPPNISILLEVFESI